MYKFITTNCLILGQYINCKKISINGCTGKKSGILAVDQITAHYTPWITQ